MKSTWLVAGLVIVVGCGVAVAFKLGRDRYASGPTHQAPPEAAPRPEGALPAPPEPSTEPAEAAADVPAEIPAEVPAQPATPAAPLPVPPAPEQRATPAVAPAPAPSGTDPAAARKPPRQSQKPGKKGGPPGERPLARDALALVGADPVAERVWVEAINDPSRGSNERKDLIEDLNEEGFEDPKYLTPDDLPLIVSRIALIEQLAPDAMDNVNAAAFAEAYKDLVNMYARVAGR